jgi:hypothetical protein
MSILHACRRKKKMPDATRACEDLRARFGGRYRVTHDECSESRSDPWTMEIVGRRGRVYPHGGELLAVEVDGRPVTANKLIALGYLLHQDGDDEKTFLVPADDLDSIAELLQLPRVRRLSDDQKARLAEAGEEYRFKPRGTDQPQGSPGPDDKGKGLEGRPTEDDAS